MFNKKINNPCWIFFIIIILIANTHLPADQPEQTNLNNQSKEKILPSTSVGVVLLVNNDAITSSQIISPLRDQLTKIAANLKQSSTGALAGDQFINQALPLIREEVMAQVYNLLLYQHARVDLDKLESIEKILESAMAQKRKELLAQYDGSEAQTQLELARKGTSIENELDQIMRDLIIASYRDTHFAPSMVITRSQMLQYYHAHLNDKYSQDSQIQFQLIDVKKNTPSLSDKAHENATQALEQIKQGVDFSQVVREFSQGFRKNQDGLWRPVDPDSLRKQYKTLVDALKKINVGSCTDIIETDEHLFIAKLIERKEAKIIPFSEVQKEINEVIRRQKWQKYSSKLSITLLEKAIITPGQNSNQAREQFINNTILTTYEQFK